MESRKEVIKLIADGDLKPARPKDIVEGNMVFLIGDDNHLHVKIIEEVLRPDDDWKAFCATDGCRYGLLDLYVKG